MCSRAAAARGVLFPGALKRRLDRAGKVVPGALKRGLGRAGKPARHVLKRRLVVADGAIEMPSRLAPHIFDYPIEILRTDGAKIISACPFEGPTPGCVFFVDEPGTGALKPLNDS